MPNRINEFHDAFEKYVEPENVIWDISNSVQLKINWSQNGELQQVKLVEVSLMRSDSKFTGDDSQFVKKVFSPNQPLVFALQLHGLDKFHQIFTDVNLILLGYIELKFRVHTVKFIDDGERSGKDYVFRLTWEILSPFAKPLTHFNMEHKPHREYEEWRINGQSVFENSDSSDVLGRLRKSVQDFICDYPEKDILWFYGLPGCGKSSLVHAWYSSILESNLKPVVIDLYNADTSPLANTQVLRQKVAEAISGERFSKQLDLFNNVLFRGVTKGMNELDGNSTLILILDGFDHCFPNGESTDKKIDPQIYRNLVLLLSTIQRRAYQRSDGSRKIKLIIIDSIAWKDRAEKLERLLGDEGLESVEFPLWGQIDIEKLLFLLNPGIANINKLSRRILRLTGGHLSLIKSILHNTEALYTKTPDDISVKISNETMEELKQIYQDRNAISTGAGRLLTLLLTNDIPRVRKNGIDPNMLDYLHELTNKNLIAEDGNMCYAIWRVGIPGKV